VRREDLTIIFLQEKILPKSCRKRPPYSSNSSESRRKEVIIKFILNIKLFIFPPFVLLIKITSSPAGQEKRFSC